MRKSQQFPGSDVIPPYPLVQEESRRGEERELTVGCRPFEKKKIIIFVCVCVFKKSLSANKKICHLRKKKDLRVIPIFFLIFTREKKRE